MGFSVALGSLGCVLMVGVTECCVDMIKSWRGGGWENGGMYISYAVYKAAWEGSRMSRS